MAPLVRFLDVEAFERWTPFVRPFRFGAVTVEGAFQAFVRVGLEVEGHGRATGMTAELMPPKWFDKRAERSAEETVRDLKASLGHAVREANRLGRADTAFGLHCALQERQAGFARAQDLTALTAHFGPAEIDKAVLDGLSRALGKSFVEVLKANAVGLDARLTPDLSESAIAARLSRLAPARSIAIRHTVGLTDRITGADSLESEIEAAALRFFKIKMGGDVASDLERLKAIAALLDGRGIDYRITLDANEQYRPETLKELFARVEAESNLNNFLSRLLFIEQPLDRRVTFEQALDPAIAARGVIIDEADDGYNAFPRARVLGYRGVSSKSCKGIYKALLNAARVETWNAEGGRALISAEDLTCQAGLAVQQDTAFVAALGLTHVERNGHHYVDGFANAPLREAEAFRAAHPDFYAGHRLSVASGDLSLSTLYGPGFAAGAEPDWATLAPLSLSVSEGLPA